jgi:prevent-host-death family protein
MREMGAGEFKTRCLAIMDEVQARREPVVITKRGKPVAKLIPMDMPSEKDPIFGFLKDKITILGDPDEWVKPIVPEGDWSDTWEPGE